MDKKIRIDITISINTYLAIQKKRDFNVSGFCDEALKKALDVKAFDIPKEEQDVDDVIIQKQTELTLLEKRKEEMKKGREKEAKRWREI